MSKPNVILYITTITKDLIEYLQDDYNFEIALRLLDDLKLQSAIQNLKTPFKYKQLVSNLFSRYVLNKQIHKPVFSKLEYSFNQYGKPSIKGINFNSSSSNDIIAIAITGSEASIGIDLSHSSQNLSPTDYMEQFKPIFNEREVGKVDSYFKFNHFWTLKEAFTKLLGCGLNLDLSKFYFNTDAFNDKDYRVFNKIGKNESTLLDIRWCEDIELNADLLFQEANVLVKNLENRFSCYSTILEYSNGKLPVICSIITQKKVNIECIEIDFLTVLQNI
ncbi:LYS5 [Candida jiufengensis]|uniref:LYS5 n=1 Tax=Candida jiufengensis TaxID=497108 RepID=UPI0022254E74|nr:LYS5 [Candida jiufengensis]KAI5954356.1 LYS5 [Candida jiufengensis]